MIPNHEIRQARGGHKLASLANKDRARAYATALEMARDLNGYNATEDMERKITKAVQVLMTDPVPNITDQELLLLVKYGVRGLLGEHKDVSYRAITSWIAIYIPMANLVMKDEGIKMYLSAPKEDPRDSIREDGLKMLRSAIEIYVKEGKLPKLWGWGKIFDFLIIEGLATSDVVENKTDSKEISYWDKARAELKAYRFNKANQFCQIVPDQDIESRAVSLFVIDYLNHNINDLLTKYHHQLLPAI
jgi:hypothetical protein